jgi:type IV pilus assembly protein PilO
MEKFDEIPASQKLLLLLLVAVGVFVGFYLGLYSTLEEELESETSRAQALATRRAELVSSQDDIERIRREIAALCARQGSVLERLPARAEVPSLLQSIHQQARLVGLDIEQFERKDDAPGASYTRIPVAMRVQGTYDQIADFFYFIGRQQRIVNVRDIRMSIVRTNNPWRATAVSSNEGLPDFLRERATIGSPPLSVTCEVSTYYADQAAAAGGDACGNVQ